MDNMETNGKRGKKDESEERGLTPGPALPTVGFLCLCLLPGPTRRLRLFGDRARLRLREGGREERKK